MIFWTGACSPGQGRDPIYTDASVYPDAGFRDATPFPDASDDAGAPDSNVGLPDATILPEYDFTGVYGILDAQDRLFARELDGKIQIVIRSWPYVYTGTIDADGVVNTSSVELTAAGCGIATITGEYDRPSATYRLEHRTCSVDGTPLLSEIVGGFQNDFNTAISGEYELAAAVMDVGNNCWTGPTTGLTVRYGFSLFDGAVAVFTAYDVIVEPAFYGGVSGPGPDFDFSALQRIDGNPEIETAIRGGFSQVTALDPVRFVGIRDVFDRTKGCSFTITLDGVRIQGP